MEWNKKTWILDGPIGTQLQKKGLPVGSIPELQSITNPNIIYEIHEEYVDSGSEIIYSNTFGANSYKLADTGYSVREVVKASMSIAKKAAGNKSMVALGMGPIGQLLEPNGTLTFEEAYEIYKEIVLCGIESGADLVVIETLSDLYEAKAGILAVKENSTLPVFVTMSLEEDGRTFLGSSLKEIVPVLEGLGVDALGINCSLGPVEVKRHAIELCSLTNLPIIIKPNAGLPDPATGKYDLNPEEFSAILNDLYYHGTTIFGGCCGSDKHFIKLLAETLKDKPPAQKKPIVRKSLVSSSTKVVPIENVVLVGERLSPVGKKVLQEAIKNKDMDYILKEVIAQVKEGADVIDVNMSLPKYDDAEIMPEIIKSIQSITNTPLQIDTTNPVAMDRGLRAYNGKAIANSVTGEKESLETILPIVKKYGASVIALTIDETGIPLKAEDRVKIAKNIINIAKSYGIPKEDVFIDCLVLTASAQQEEVFETLKATRMVKEQLGVKTMLGVSNISFGLPNRELINESFFTMALYAGLDIAIINTGVPNMMNQVYAYRVLSNLDKGSVNYIELFDENKMKKSKDKATKSDIKEKNTLEDAIINGYKNEVADITRELLLTKKELDIIENHLIIALDIVGKKFETGEMFLPQLLQSANTAQKSFHVLKESMIKKGTTTESKGKILLATVKGDVHDIGKNIVKVILQNYGYEIIDLGKDVPIEKIVHTVVEQNIKLVGLSALMTTTLKNMELTITAIKEVSPNCKIAVGGAVLTDEFSKLIKADYYGKDATSAIEIAKKVFE